MCNVWLKIANYILRRSNVKNPSFDSASDVNYSTFDGRTSDVEYSTLDRRSVECRIFDVRRRPITDRKSNRIFLHTSNVHQRFPQRVTPRRKLREKSLRQKSFPKMLNYSYGVTKQSHTYIITRNICRPTNAILRTLESKVDEQPISPRPNRDSFPTPRETMKYRVRNPVRRGQKTTHASGEAL